MTEFEKQERAKCKDKVRFTSASFAEEAIAHLKKKFRKVPPKTCYKCPWCHYWHLRTVRKTNRAKDRATTQAT